MWTVTRDGETRKASIRTSRDRWIVFQPLKKGTAWKTLGEVDLVIVSVVDNKEDPQNVEVYIFPANKVRSRFDKAYAARIKAGLVQKDGFGMWVCLDHDPRGIASSVGSGIVGKYGKIASYPIASLLQAAPTAADDVTDADEGAEDQVPPEVQQAKAGHCAQDDRRGDGLDA
jgi:hypothetical protein